MANVSNLIGLFEFLSTEDILSAMVSLKASPISTKYQMKYEINEDENIFLKNYEEISIAMNLNNDVTNNYKRNHGIPMTRRCGKHISKKRYNQLIKKKWERILSEIYPKITEDFEKIINHAILNAAFNKYDEYVDYRQLNKFDLKGGINP